MVFRQKLRQAFTRIGFALPAAFVLAVPSYGASISVPTPTGPVVITTPDPVTPTTPTGTTTTASADGTTTQTGATVAPTSPTDAVQRIALPDGGAASVRALANSRINQFITNRVMGGILLGANEQVNGCNCVSAYSAFGSVSGGFHGRYGVNDNLTLLAGASASTHRDGLADVGVSPTVALSARYDLVELGSARPYFEAGGVFSPSETVRYRRPYATSAGSAAGSADTTDANYVGFARVGYVARLTPRDEVAVSADYSRGWQRVRGYTEPTTASNLFAAAVPSGTDVVNIAKFGGQYTRLLTETIEANVNGGLGYAFDLRSGVAPVIAGLLPVARPRLVDTAFFEGGARLGFRISERVVVDTFGVAAVGPQPVGRSVHGGVGLRYQF